MSLSTKHYEVKSERKSTQMSDEKKEILNIIQSKFDEFDPIMAACVYGSWPYEEKATDLDVAIILDSNEGIVEKEHYRDLKLMRKALNKETLCDVDLVTHTMDEFDYPCSPIWYPRHNSSLIGGQNIKGDFPIEPVSKKQPVLDIASIAAFVLLENRTVCRRQLLRSLRRHEARIYISKMLHGPANVLIYMACRNGEEFPDPPHHFVVSIKRTDDLLSLNSEAAMVFLHECKSREPLNFEQASLLMLWYECLIAVALRGQAHKSTYQEVCSMLRSK